MKKTVLLLFFCLNVVCSFSQVANDSCLSATNLDTITNFSISGCFFGGPNFILMDSTVNAQTNFPYPQIPSPCVGYVPSPAPTNDVWYKFYSRCELEFAVFSSDTVHISFWYGPDCANLTPLNCFTIPANQNFSSIVNTYLPDTFGLHWLQVAGTLTNADVHFNICVCSPQLVCSNTISFSGSTPVLCFNYDADKSDCSSAGVNDGTVSINITQGNGPFSCLWTDGNTSFTRTGLAPGIYYYTISDYTGCSENDSVEIYVATSVKKTDEGFFNCVYSEPDHTLQLYFTPTSKLAGAKIYLLLYDAEGKKVFSDSVYLRSSPVIIKLNKKRSPSFYTASLYKDKRLLFTQKILTIHTNY